MINTEALRKIIYVKKAEVTFINEVLEEDKAFSDYNLRLDRVCKAFYI